MWYVHQTWRKSDVFNPTLSIEVTSNQMGLKRKNTISNDIAHLVVGIIIGYCFFHTPVCFCSHLSSCLLTWPDMNIICEYDLIYIFYPILFAQILTHYLGNTVSTTFRLPMNTLLLCNILSPIHVKLYDWGKGHIHHNIIKPMHI